MHAALAIPDILHEIFGFMTPSTDTYPWTKNPHAKDLLCATLACRAFSSPALDVLWMRLDSILPLLKFLPTFEIVDGVYIFTGAILRSHWLRFDYYASRVHQITYRHHDEIDPSVYVRLLRLRRAPLFPRLRSLVWENAKFATIERLFVVPTLVSVKFSVDHWEHPDLDHAFEAFLESLIENAPSLQHFVHHGTLERTCLDSIAKFTGLSSLDLTGEISRTEDDLPIGGRSLITGQMYRAFTQMDHLRRLSLYLDEVHGLHAAFASSRMEFKRLETLHLEGWFPTMIFMLGRLSASKLEDLCISFLPEEINEYRLLFRTVPFVSLPRLRSFTLKTKTDREWWLERSSLEFSHVFPDTLLALKEIADISFDLCGLTLEMDNTHVEAIASAWPNLENFRLTNESLPESSRTGGAPWPTVYCLESFVRHCPRLRRLGVPMDMWCFMPDDALTSSHCLEELWVTDSVHVLDQSTTAEIMNGLFPFVQLRCDSDGSSLPYDWKQVADAIARIRGVPCESEEELRYQEELTRLQQETDYDAEWPVWDPWGIS